MLDSKSTTSRRRNIRTRTRRSRVSRPLTFGLQGPQTTSITCRWNYSNIATNSAGVLSSADISPSIANASEYGTLSSLYGEVKLIACTIIFSNTCTQECTNGRVMMGTQMQANQNSHASTPLTISQVENLANVRYLNVGYSVFDRPFVYRMVVLPLDYASITSDAPTPVTPWAGSPGCVYLFGDNLSVDFSYLKADVIATFKFRGRV